MRVFTTTPTALFLRSLVYSTFGVIAATAQTIAGPQAPLDDYIQSHSIVEIAATVGLSTSWPRLDGASITDRRTALSFLKQCDQEHVGRASDKTRQTALYVSLISNMRKAGGYLNAVLQDTLFRMALSDIARTLVRHPEQASALETELASLQPGPLNSSGIGRIIADHFGDAAREAEYSNWPEENRLSRVNVLFGAKSLFFAPSTSVLIEQPSPHDLIHRMAETQWMLTYVLPGALSYLKHGGNLKDLDGGHVTPFIVLMGIDRRQFQFPMYGVTELSALDLITLRDDFGSPDKRPRFLNSTLK